MTTKHSWPLRRRGESTKTPSELRLTRYTLANANRQIEEAIRTLTGALREEHPGYVDDDLRMAEIALDNARLMLHLFRGACEDAPPQARFMPNKVDRRMGCKPSRPSTRGRLKGWPWLAELLPANSKKPA
jgi:hypothetical protein